MGGCPSPARAYPLTDRPPGRAAPAGRRVRHPGAGALKDVAGTTCDGAILINTARGGVVDELALRTLLTRRPGMAAVIDCWCHEPDIDAELLQRAAIGTPHIAGYSDAAKLRATEMLYQSACEFLSVPTEWQPPAAADTLRTLCLDEAATDEDLLRRAVFACYDARDDHRALAEIDELPLAERGQRFDALRAHYRTRREFSALEVLAPSDRPAFRALLRALGFGVVSPSTFPSPRA